jgi:hypothetical protein
MRSKAFRRSFGIVYGFRARVAISWISALLEQDLGEVLRIVRSQKREVVLAHCVWGRFFIRGCELIKIIVEGHCCISSCGWQGSWWCNFECIIYVHVKHVIACLIDIFPCFELFFNHGKFCINGGFLFTCIGYNYSFWVVLYWKCRCLC